MRRLTKTIRVVLSLLIIVSALIAPPLANAFQEGWESSTIGIYMPDSLPLPLIPADEGDWILGDTVSESPECGSTPHTAEILLSGGNRSLRLTSNDSSSSCADNVWVNLFEVPQLNLNPGFSVPLTPGTIISFEETGNLINPETGFPNCVLPPCGDTVSLTLEDTRGNLLAYLLQRAPGAVPNEVRSFYREVFLDPNAGAYSRNLFADFNTIPDFNPIGATIRTVAFQVKEHGTATIDKICIGTSGCVPPSLVPSANFSANPTSGDAPLNVNFTDESTGTITSWIWNFGDGASSTIQNPSHTYTNKGTYSVSLTVSGTYGSDIETKTDYISIAEIVSSDVIYESALLGTTGINGGAAIGQTTTNQWMLGSRFSLSSATQITAVGGHIGNMSIEDFYFDPDAEIYVAIVPLKSNTALPSFLPSDLEVHAIAATTFIPGNTLASSEDLSVPISISLQPGDYGLIFGTGLWGANGSAAMPTNNPLLPGTSFFLGTTDDFWNAVYADTLGMRFVVEGILLPNSLKAMPWIPLLLLGE